MLFRKLGISVSLLVLIVSSLLFAQIRSATITGTVTDVSQAAVPDAAVVVTQQETGSSTTVRTTEAGSFTAPYLAAGTYTVTVNAAGFTAYKQTGIVVRVNETARVDVALQVGAVEQAIEVSAQAADPDRQQHGPRRGGQRRNRRSANPTSNPLYYARLQAAWLRGMQRRTRPR